MNQIALNILCAVIPSVVSGVCLFIIERKMAKRHDETEKHEADHVKNETHIIKTLIATAEGTEAIAKAIQRVPDAHCNGDMKAAILKVEKALDEQRSFLQEKAVEATAK
jgi:hypothetical protein